MTSPFCIDCAAQVAFILFALLLLSFFGINNGPINLFREAHWALKHGRRGNE